MTTGSTRNFTNDPRSHWMPGVILGLLFLGALGYIVVVPEYIAAPEMNESSWFALTDQATESASMTAESTVDPSTVQVEGVTTASASAARTNRGDIN